MCIRMARKKVIRLIKMKRKSSKIKKLLTIPILLFTLMFSSTSYAEWKEVSKTISGITFYLDFEKIRKHNGYVYYWYLMDLLKPSKHGHLSIKIYNEGDCKLFRYKPLSFAHHKEPMGEGFAEVSNSLINEWRYPPPKTGLARTLIRACEAVQ